MSYKHFGGNCLLLAMGLTLAAPRGAEAQDSLAVAGQGQVHVVQLGETLWELARLYMGDPLLWPEIYRINTMVVEDPHWIFPGEELFLVPPDTTMVAVAPPVSDTTQGVQRPVTDPAPADTTVEMPVAPPPPPPIREDAPTVFAERRVRGASPGAGPASDTYRAVRRGDFYAAGFLTERDTLPWGLVRGNAEPTSTRAAFGGTTAMLHGSISVRAPSGATYHVGDTLLIARRAREVPGWGRVIRPTGLARVTYATGRDAEAEVIMQFSRVGTGQVAMPVEPFRAPGSVRPGAVQEGTTARIIEPRDPHPIANQQNVVFIDLGRQDGIVPGDVFEVIRPRPAGAPADRPPERIGVLQVVHVRERSASAMVFHIYDTGIRSGAMVRLIAKMPS